MRFRFAAVVAFALPTFAVGILVAAAADAIDEASLSAGAFTIARFDETAFAEPAPVLNYSQNQRFMRGRFHFNQRWVVAPSLQGDWGLGPTFIADRCSTCHVGAGRGAPPVQPDEQLFSVLLRLSVSGEDEHGKPQPHPNYGDQIQNQGLMGQDRDGTLLGERVTPEAEVFMDWETKTVKLADGESVELRKPKVRFGKLYFGEIGKNTMMSLRIAQPLQGLGLLEAIPEEALRDIAKSQSAAGFNGRLNTVYDEIGKRPATGRFGWKANQPTIRQQIAAAFHGDLGVTTSLFRQENCPPIQAACAAQPPGNDPELVDQNWDELEFWSQALAVPARRNMKDPDVQRGEKLFAEAQCAVCHVPALTAGKYPALPQIEGQVARAYTDLLLHDMGEELADHRPEFKASGRDWRTPPLWGLGLSQTVSKSTAMLHDGRARNVAEAILWHGGEAKGSRDKFSKMSKADREALIKFVNSI